MDDERFQVIYQLVLELAPPRARRCQYSDGDVLLILLWAALRQKPIVWACDPRNAPRVLRGRALPSPSRMSRRVREPALEALLEHVITTLRQCLLVTLGVTMFGCWSMDAKGFTVNQYSKDAHARRGYCQGTKSRGYKLHLMIDAHGLPVVWRVAPMNMAEPVMARRLLQHVDRPGYVLADSAMNSNWLFGLARSLGLQLVSPRKKPGTGLGNRRHDPARLRSIAMLEGSANGYGTWLYNHRTAIERVFARWSASDIGLDHLPGWVRTPGRVRRWVSAKILIALATRSMEVGRR